MTMRIEEELGDENDNTEETRESHLILQVKKEEIYQTKDRNRKGKWKWNKK